MGTKTENLNSADIAFAFEALIDICQQVTKDELSSLMANEDAVNELLGAAETYLDFAYRIIDTKVMPYTDE